MKRLHYLPILILVALLMSGLPAGRDYLHRLSVEEGHGRGIATPVVMYTTRWCPSCYKAREYFKRHSINYIEHDIEASAENLEKFRELDGTGVPLILVGNRRLMGFSPRSFDELLR
jgi:glutaredoxin